MDNNQQRNNRPSGEQGPQRGSRKNNSTFMIFLVVTLVTLLVMAFVNNVFNSGSSVEITYDRFLEMLEKGEVESVVIYSDQLEIKTTVNELATFYFGKQEVTYYTGNPDDPNLVARLDQAGVEFKYQIPDTLTNMILSMVLSLAPLIVIWIIFAFAMRKMGGGSGVMGVGKSKAKVYIRTRPAGD